jgi:hypothetical protein
VHRRVRRDPRRSLKPNAPREAKSTEVVALDIDDHGELGAFLGIGIELGGQGTVTLRVVVSRSGTFDGYGAGDATRFELQEELR